MGKLHVETPAILSPSLTKLCGRDVYLKLENLQPSGSFKLRGIGHLCEEVCKQQAADICLLRPQYQLVEFAVTLHSNCLLLWLLISEHLHNV